MLREHSKVKFHNVYNIIWNVSLIFAYIAFKIEKQDVLNVKKTFRNNFL